MFRTLVGDPLKARDDAQLGGGPAPEWMLGEGGIVVEQLVLVSLRRVSVGCWVPCIRLLDDAGLGPVSGTVSDQVSDPAPGPVLGQVLGPMLCPMLGPVLDLERELLLSPASVPTLRSDAAEMLVDHGSMAHGSNIVYDA
jgi:hypothetical protein